MIDKLYYYFIKTKYAEFNMDDLANLKKLHERVHASGLSASIVSSIKKSSIEKGIIDRELNAEERRADNWILTNPFIISSFIHDQMDRSNPESLKSLSQSLKSIKTDILSGMDAETLRKAFAAGLT